MPCLRTANRRCYSKSMCRTTSCGKTTSVRFRRLRVGGEISFPKTGTYINAGFENVQNYIYFDADCKPRQESGNIQVISATLKQKFAAGIFHLDAEGIYQFTSNSKGITLATIQRVWQLV